MKKLIKFKRDAQTFFDIAEQKYDEGNIKDAIYYFYQSFLLSGDIDLLLALGDAYAEIGECEEGLKYLFRALDAYPDDDEILDSLSNCFLQLNQEELAFYYSAVDLHLDTFKQIMQSADPKKDSSPIRMLEKKEDMALNIAIKLLESGDMDYAKELLLTITPDSQYYVTACNLLALSFLEQKMPNESIEYSKKALAVKENLDSNCNLMLAYNMLENHEEVEKINKIVSGLRLDRDGHKTASLCYIRMNDAQNAYYHLSNVIKYNKYSSDVLVSLALSAYNLGKTDDAKSLIMEAGKLYPASITIAEFAKSINKSQPLTLYPILNEKTANEWLDEVEQKLTTAKTRRRDFFDDEQFKRQITWIFQSRLPVYQSKIALILGKYKKWRNFFCERMLDNTLDLSVKKVCLFSHLYRQEKGSVGIVIEGIYSRLNPKYPLECSKDFLRAYSYAFSSFAFLGSDFEQRIYLAANLIWLKYSALQKTEDVFDESVIAAAIFYKTGHKKIRSTISAAQIFSADHKKLLKFIKLLELEKGKKK